MSPESAVDCRLFRERICIDPNDSDATLLAHAAACTACAAWAQRARAAELLIGRAVRLDPGIGSRWRGGTVRWASLAAAAVAAMAVWFGLGSERPASSAVLAREILAHLDHDHGTLLENTSSVSARHLEDVLAGAARIDLVALERTTIGPISYARKCAVAGQWMSHLVVQTADGPMTIMLISEQTLDAVVPLGSTERGVGGSILPHGGGAVAILGDRDAMATSLTADIAAMIDISI